MMMLFRSALLSFLVGSAMFADSKMAFSELPTAVQQAAKAQTGSATIVGASKEVEKGKTTYEVETKVEGRTRDLTFDDKGKLLTVEQEVSLDSLPELAQEYVKARAAGRPIKKVESLTEGESVSYEVSIVASSRRTIEVGVNPDGTPHRN